MTSEVIFFEKNMVYSMSLTDMGENNSLYGEYSLVSEIEYNGEKPDDWDENERDFSSVHYDYVEKLKENPSAVFRASADL